MPTIGSRIASALKSFAAMLRGREAGSQQPAPADSTNEQPKPDTPAITVGPAWLKCRLSAGSFSSERLATFDTNRGEVAILVEGFEATPATVPSPGESIPGRIRVHALSVGDPWAWVLLPPSQHNELRHAFVRVSDLEPFQSPPPCPHPF